MIRSNGTPTERIRVTEVRSDRSVEREDEAAAEEPLEIRVVPGEADRAGPYQIAVTLRTPGSDFELAVGFLFSEGLLRAPEDVTRIAYCTDPGELQHHNIVNVSLAAGVPFDRERFRRNFYSTSSCGVCGKAALDQIRARVDRPPVGRFRISSETLESLPGRITSAQRVFDRTGGLHAAALFRPEGDLLLLREDVGRHNALDKVVGSRFLAGSLPDSNTLLLVSGRAGFELVQKAAVAGIPFLAAIGAPSSLAIALAREQGMTLVGFLREGRFNIYCGQDRVAL
ncbi:MAG TPA: formate dehydrogenase accessory sulfurtransferase FdhD [Thermoplasmata archaeon]|nr:formate dehydrogenase accessory sulfurtransferase FdhD [Thermoplasmata archaeon]